MYDHALARSGTALTTIRRLFHQYRHAATASVKVRIRSVFRWRFMNAFSEGTLELSKKSTAALVGQTPAGRAHETHQRCRRPVVALARPR
jgi:hypothetical protein